MCSTCGCDQPGGVTITRVGEQQINFTPLAGGLLTAPVNRHQTLQSGKTLIEVEQDILSKNNQLAEHNRYHFKKDGIMAINLVSSPGSGKTSLLESTLLQSDLKYYVIEGDQQTMNDANRIAKTGAPVVQINTGKGCHLDANMVHHALHKLSPVPESIVFIENVGNLVCPALFDLGENYRVAIISVTEGDDKPLKYPDMFESSDLCIINKVDLLPYVEFDVDKCKKYARMANPKIEFLELSATRGDGIDAWIDWLMEKSNIVERV